MCSCTEKIGFIKLSKPCEWEIEQAPECWRISLPEPQKSPDPEDETEDEPITENIQSEIEVQKENVEKSLQPLSSTTESLVSVTEESVEKVCPSDIPTEDLWFCDNRQACFKLLRFSVSE